MVNFHKIYVLQHSAKNEKEYTERRKQILLNLAVGNITADKIKFVKLIPQPSVLFDHYMYKSDCDLKKAHILITQLKICRIIAEKTPNAYQGSIIMTDSTILHEYWDKLIFDMLDNVPNETNLFIMGYNTNNDDHDNLQWRGKTSSEENICGYLPNQTIGCSMYLISKKHCGKVLDKVDRPMRSMIGNHSVQRIIDSISDKESSTILVSYPAIATIAKNECILDEQKETDSIWTEANNYYCITDEKLRAKNVSKSKKKDKKKNEHISPELSLDDKKDEDSSSM